jgi:hypothetical protein
VVQYTQRRINGYRKNEDRMAAMRVKTSGTRTFRIGSVAIAAVAFSLWLALGTISQASAQSDGAAGDAQSSEPDQTAASPEDAATNAAQQAHDAADAAQQELESATESRDQLESDGAAQDQIDAANAAIAQARANKDAADSAAQTADEAVTH